MDRITFNPECDLSIPLSNLAGWHVWLRWSPGVVPLVIGTVCIDSVDSDGDLIVREVDTETGRAVDNATVAVPLDSLHGVHVL